MEKVTLKQLAERLNLSTATVSLALRDDPLIAEKTRRRVRELANELDYVSNNMGRALQSSRSHLIGYLIHGVTKSFYNEVLQGAGDAASRTGYGLLVNWITADEKNNFHQMEMMLEKNVDAIIISEHIGATDTFSERFLRRGKPVIYCTGKAAKNCSAVVSNDFSGGKTAMEVLHRYHHKKVLITPQWQLRYEGNLAAAEQLDMETVSYNSQKEALDLIRKNPDITAVAAYSDEEAMDLMYSLRANNYRVPEDISIIGFNDSTICSRPEFQLSTIAQQRQKLGECAVELAIDLIEKRQSNPTTIELDTYYVERKTVAVNKYFNQK